MVAENSTASPVAVTDRNPLHAEPELAKEGDYGTLILDEQGNICSCGIAAGKLFGGNLSDYMGKPISSLIPNLALHNTSQSYS
ncbi:MAG: hypothetical protein NTY41_17045, partial [Proteobacteria bacterium]|nr:hypothetical protein [Pseudomonadota bacterium]